MTDQIEKMKRNQAEIALLDYIERYGLSDSARKYFELEDDHQNETLPREPDYLVGLDVDKDVYDFGPDSEGG